MSDMRLDKFISSQLTDVSRSEVKNLCRRGYVTVNGVGVRSSEIKIDPDTADVRINGKPVVYKKHLYIMLNKPAGVVSSTRDGLSQTVLELLPEDIRRQGLFPAGRLDKDTEGFILITDDGMLAHKMLSPKSHVPKTYFVTLEKPVEEGTKEAFAKGIEIDGGDRCMPAELEFCVSEKECVLTIHEGMYHQVKRMFEAVGNRVVFLKRTAIGRLTLDPNLKAGESRELSGEEIKMLLDGGN